MRSLWTKGLLCMGVLLLAVLLLSALVEGPPAIDGPLAAEAAKEPLMPVQDSAMVAYAAMQPEGKNQLVPLNGETQRGSTVAVRQNMRVGVHAAVFCDANGRVIRTRRYAQSVHQLFRQEVAGG